jgi:hypothetical protein
LTSDKVTPVQYREKITWSSTRNAEGKDTNKKTKIAYNLEIPVSNNISRKKKLKKSQK